MQNIKDLELLLNSAALIIIETREEARVMGMVDHLINHIAKPVFRWTVTEGLQRLDVEQPAQLYNAKPLEILTQIKLTGAAGVYLLLDFHPYLEDPVHVRLLKDMSILHTISCSYPMNSKYRKNLNVIVQDSIFPFLIAAL